MKNRAISGSGLILAVVGMLTTNVGCVDTLSAHKNLEENTRKLFAHVRGEDVSLPQNAAYFCLERARINFATAKSHSAIDGVLLGGAAGVGAIALTLQALGAALPAPTEEADSPKKGFEVAGVAAVALAAGLLTIRTAAGQSEVALAQRSAAAKQVDTAFSLLAKYALTEDFKEVTDDGFSGCRDADLDVAKSFPGLSANDPLQKSFTAAQAAKEEVKQEAAKSKDIVARTKIDLTKKNLDVKKAEDALKQASTKVEETTKRGDKNAGVQAKKDEEKAREEKVNAQEALEEAKNQANNAEKDNLCKEAKVAVAEQGGVLIKKASWLRRAVFFGTKTDGELAASELKEAQTELDSLRKQRDAMCKSLAP